MAMNENVPEFPAARNATKERSFGLHPLHEAAMRIADIGRGRSRSKTKDLITVLMAHGARAWRYQQPEARIHLHIGAANRRAPVLMRLR